MDVWRSEINRAIIYTQISLRHTPTSRVRHIALQEQSPLLLSALRQTVLPVLPHNQFDEEITAEDEP